MTDDVIHQASHRNVSPRRSRSEPKSKSSWPSAFASVKRRWRDRDTDVSHLLRSLPANYTIIKKAGRNTAPQKEETRKTPAEVCFAYKRIKGIHQQDKY